MTFHIIKKNGKFFRLMIIIFALFLIPLIFAGTVHITSPTSVNIQNTSNGTVIIIPPEEPINYSVYSNYSTTSGTADFWDLLDTPADILFSDLSCSDIDLEDCGGEVTVGTLDILDNQLLFATDNGLIRTSGPYGISIITQSGAFPSGDINIFAGNNTQSVTGGDVNITAGIGQFVGGSISLKAGDGGTSNGTIQLLSPLCDSLGNCFTLLELNQTSNLTDYAKYQFLNNNFNGSGNFTTTGYGQFAWIDELAQDTPPLTPPLYTLRIYTDYDAVSGFSIYKYKDDTGMIRRYGDNVFIGKNTGVVTIPAMSVVYSCGSSGLGAYPLLCLARADNFSTMPSVGVTIEEIGNGAYGRVMSVGVLENVNTNAWNSNAPLYVSDTQAGNMTITPPLTPNYTQEVGTVLVKSATAGKIQLVARSLTGHEFGTTNSFTVVGNITTTNYGFFGWLGSLTSRITKLWAVDIDMNGTLQMNTGNITNSSYIRFNQISGACDLTITHSICSNATGMYIVG